MSQHDCREDPSAQVGSWVVWSFEQPESIPRLSLQSAAAQLGSITAPPTASYAVQKIPPGDASVHAKIRSVTGGNLLQECLSQPDTTLSSRRHIRRLIHRQEEN
jgi:hypothetical protein